jgi:hypothetical protein
MASRQLNDWLESYTDYTEDQESPLRIHTWTGLAVVAGAIGRKLWIDRNVYTLYPNLYICIVANSAKVRKSVATSLGVNLLLEAAPNTRYIEDRMTPEGLVKQMNNTVIAPNGQQIQESTVFIYEDELAALFGYDKQSASRMSTLLTGIYGCKEQYMHTTVSGGQKVIHRPCVNILAATAPEGLATIPTDASGGFLGRLIIVASGQRRRNIAWPGKMNLSLKKALIEDLTAITALNGEMIVTPDAAKYFEVWYNKQAAITFKERWLEAFHERCHDTVLKLAMIHSVSRSDALIVNEAHIEAGCKLIESILPDLKGVGVWLIPDTFGQGRAKVEDVIAKAGQIKRSEVMNITKASAKEMDEIEITLEQQGVIEIMPIPRDRVYIMKKKP